MASRLLYFLFMDLSKKLHSSSLIPKPKHGTHFDIFYKVQDAEAR